jgi:phage terminase large subunit-like protein
VSDENAILQYWKAISTGEINAGKWIRLLYDVILEGEASGRWFFDTGKANNAIAFIERFCHHFKGKLAPGRIKLELWQRASISLIFGVVDAKGRRQFREVAWYIGRKMGKSLIAAGIMEYIAFAAGEFGSEIYFLATKVDQADLSYSAFEFNFRHEPVLGKRIKSTKRGLVIEETNTLIKRLPFSDKTLDGL